MAISQSTNKVKTFRQTVETEWKKPNSAILQHLKETADSKGYPNVPNWSEFIQGKNEVEVYSTLMNYILKSKLPLPSSDNSIDHIQQLFMTFSRRSRSGFVHANHLNGSLIHRLTDSKKYQYDYDEYTLGYFPKYVQPNAISNYFAEGERLKCEIINKESPTFLWTEEHGTSRLMDTMRRVGVKHLNEKSLRSFFAHAGQIAAQFNVNTAKNLYNTVSGETIFDISCGWGDRLTGFYLSNKKSYFGTDPNLNMFEIYKKMCLQYEKWLGNSNPKIVEKKNCFEVKGIKNVRIYNLPAEDLNYQEIPDIDLTFSSPPYFNKELYGKDSKAEGNQSWNRYKTGEAWLEDFLYCIMDQLLPKSKTTMINITDIGIDKNRVFICDPMVNRYRDQFVGIAGFEMSQNMNVGQKKKEQIYTEPIWTFGQNPYREQKSILSLFE